MKKIYTIALILSATLFAASPAKAEDERVTNDDIFTSKTVTENSDGTYTLTLETYVKGSSTTKTETIRKPADIVLVLDVSGSMTNTYTSEETYTKKQSTNYSYDSYSNQTLYFKWTDGTYKQVKRNRSGKSTNYRYSLTFTVGSTTYYLKADGTYTTDETTVSGNKTTIFTGELYSRSTKNVSRMEALQSAVSAFIDVIKADAEENDVNHRISIVQYGNGYPNTNYTNPNSNDYLKEDSKYGNSSVLKRFYSVNEGTNAQDLKDAVNAISASNAYTNSGEGMNLAKLLMNSFSRSDTETEKYTKTVVMFTDGVPCNTGMGQDWNESIANAAINNSKLMKDAGITVFTVGILSGYTDDSDVIRYMNAVSSNYPKATGYTKDKMGKPGEKTTYYKNASDGGLEGIFEDIAKESTGGGSDVAMNATNTTVVLDIMTNYFKLPAGSSSVINLYTSDLDASKSDLASETPAFKTRVAWTPWTNNSIKTEIMKDEDGNEMYYEGTTTKRLKYDSDLDKDVDKDDFILINRSVRGVEIEDSDKDYVEVTGYDYAAHYVGVDEVTDESGTTKSWHDAAQKLIIEFVIEKDPANTGGVELPTNDPASGVYTIGKSGEYEVIENYEQPLTYLPYLKVIKTGMKNGQSAIFTITGKNTNAMVVLTQGADLTVSPYAIIKLRDAGEYTVTENTGWSWEYGKISWSKNGTSWTAFPEGTTVFSLAQTLSHADTWTADNCYLTYYFKNETESPVKHDESAVNNIFYGDGTVTGRDVK